jgi:hypothetical protein
MTIRLGRHIFGLAGILFGIFSCRRSGITSLPINMLICAVSLRHGWEILTADRDFIHYRQAVSLRLFSAS